MRWYPIAFAFSMVLSLASPCASSAAASTSASSTMLRPALTSTPANLQAFTAPSACAQHPGAPNCADALAHGLVLFAWTCAGCNPGWSALFVVNGQPSSPTDITLAPSKLLALSVRSNQFKPTDCVAIRIYNPANQAQNATSNSVCMSSVLALRVTTPIVHAGPGTIGPTTTQSSTTGANIHPGTNPALSHNAVILNPFAVPAPSGMNITHDQPTCASHGGLGGGFACMAGLPAGMLALVWNCNNCKVDGYHLYRVDGGQHTLLPANGAYGNDATVTLALLSPPGDGFNGKCYAVTAYKGSNESAMSNWACAGLSSAAQTTTLSPAHVLRWERGRDLRTGVLGYTNPPSDFYDGSMWVGYADFYGENPAGDLYHDRFDRTGLFFDLSSLNGHAIYKAMLKMSALSSWHNFDSTDWTKVDVANLSDQSPSVCVSLIDMATDHWWLNNDLNSSVSYLAPGGFQGPDFSVDVTSAVANWNTSLGASSDFGFILRGDDENDQWHGNAHHVCMTQLQSASLVVTYY